MITPGGQGQQFVVLNDGSTEVVLAGPFPAGSTQRSYPAVGGWLAHAKQSTTVDQVWIRTPTGEDIQASAVGRPATVESLAPNGGLVFRTPESRFLAVPPFTSLAGEVATRVGRGLFVDGQPLVAIGRSLFGVR